MVQKPDFLMTVEELRTVRTILKTLVDRDMLPINQMKIVKEVIKKMDSTNTGDLN